MAEGNVAHEAELLPDRHEYTDGKSGVWLPPDCPAYVRFWRLMGDVNGARGRKAAILEVDALFNGLKFFIRFGAMEESGQVKLMVEYADGTKEVLGEWEPSG